MVIVAGTRNQVFSRVPFKAMNQIKKPQVGQILGFRYSTCGRSFDWDNASSGFGVVTGSEKGRRAHIISCSGKQNTQLVPRTSVAEKKMVKRSGSREHHLWMKRDSAGSGQKALNLVRIISELSNEKEVVYGALDKWTAWEVEFPLIAAAKALRILTKRNQWKRVIQVAKWMLSKGQGATMGTYDALLLAFDMDKRVDEAESLWNMILHTHTRSISKQLFSRMTALYYHHNLPDKIIEVFADMEELGVKPDEDTVRRVARAFQTVGQEEKRMLVLKRYQCKWKYIHFNGERVRVKTHPWGQ